MPAKGTLESIDIIEHFGPSVAWSHCSRRGAILGALEYIKPSIDAIDAKFDKLAKAGG